MAHEQREQEKQIKMVKLLKKLDAELEKLEKEKGRLSNEADSFNNARKEFRALSPMHFENRVKELASKIGTISSRIQKLEKSRKLLLLAKGKAEAADESKDDGPAVDYQGRYHPLLPTPQQAEANPEEVFSDHLPEMVEYQGRIIIFWNLLFPDVASGFAEREHSYQENKEDFRDPRDSLLAQERAQRLVLAIARMVEQQGAIGFAAQEYWLNDKLESQLLALLGENWSVYKTESERGLHCAYFSKEAPPYISPVGNFSCVQKGLMENAPDDGREAIVLYELASMQIMTFSDHTVVNLHLHHQLKPTAHTLFLKNLLKDLQEDPKIKMPIYVMGDANMRIFHQARVAQRELGVTSVVRSMFSHDGKNQGTDYGHIALVGEKDGYSQPVSSVLDPRTGEKCVLSPVKPSDFTVDQQAGLKRFRPALALGTRAENQPVIGDLSCEAYQAHVQKFCHDVSVSLSVNGFSEVGLSFVFPFNQTQKINKFISENALIFSEVQMKDDGTAGLVFSVPMNYAGLLDAFFSKYAEAYPNPPAKPAEASKSRGWGSWFSEGPKSVALPSPQTDILPKELLTLGEAFRASKPNKLDAVKVNQLDADKEKIKAYTQDMRCFVRLYASLLFAECLLRHHGRDKADLGKLHLDASKFYFLDTAVNLAKKYLEETEKSLRESLPFLSKEERTLLSGQMAKTEEARNNLASADPAGSSKLSLDSSKEPRPQHVQKMQKMQSAFGEPEGHLARMDSFLQEKNSSPAASAASLLF
jgi:hypothetical protein